MVQWLRLQAADARVPSSLRAEIPHAMKHGQKITTMITTTKLYTQENIIWTWETEIIKLILTAENIKERVQGIYTVVSTG